jgi:hypothetical protein
MGIIERINKSVVWIHLDQERDQWRAVVTTEMNLRVPQYVENYMSG